jgi:citrate lyase acyl carrier protein
MGSPKSAVAGNNRKGDAVVEVCESPRAPDHGGSNPAPAAGDVSGVSGAPGAGVTVAITSPVRDLFAQQQDAAVCGVLQQLGVHNAHVVVVDQHALDWVLRARVAAAIARLRAAGGRI